MIMLNLDNLKPFDRNPNAADSIIVGETEGIMWVKLFSLFLNKISGASCGIL